MASYREIRKYTFTVLTRDNAQHLTLNDNAGERAPQAVITLNDPSATWFAIRAYARRNGIAPSRVGYASRPALAHEV